MITPALAAPVVSHAQTVVDGRFAVETVASLSPYTPVGVTWAPDGRMFVWTKNGTVRVVKNGSVLPTPFIDISSHVNVVNDRGLLGLALDPQFASNGYVYLFYVYEGGGNPSSTGPKTGRLTRVQADPSNPDVALPGETVILGTISSPPCGNYPAGSDCIGFDSDSHAADTLLFASDGTLFVSLGDGGAYQQADPLSLRAQSLDHYNGKILRILPDGSAPPDNPFYDGTSSIRSKVYAYGLRNPFRFSLEPTSGLPVIGDVGWSQREEVNLGYGKNFGWPCFEGELRLAEYTALSPVCANLPASAVTFPAYAYSHAEGSAITGGVVYSGTTFPAEYQGRYFFADYSGNWMRSGRLDASGQLLDVQPFASNLGGPVDIKEGPDGALYYVAFAAGQVRRIRFTPAVAPIVKAAATPTSGYSPLAVQFSSAGSASPDGSTLSYRWDFGDGTSSTLPNPAKTYSAATVTGFDARLTVTTGRGGTGSASVRIVVGSTPPTAAITAPAPGAAAVTGQPIAFSASGSDADETLPAAAFAWKILLHHDNHVHVESTASGRSGSFVVGDHGAGTYFYELELTVTDSSGLATRRTVRTALVTSAGAYRINAGGPAYTDTLGQLWSADSGFNTGTAASTTNPIPDPNAPLYQTERWDPAEAPELAYQLPLANGSYRVNLHFAEIYAGAASVGARVFDVYLEGARVLQGLDIFKEVGFEKPLVKSFTVQVSDGALTIAFGHVVENPKISAIEVLPSTGTPPPPTTYTLTVGKAGTGSGTVTSSPAGISCGADCSEPYASGTSVTLTPAAASGSTFTGWSGACTGTAGCVVTMSSNLAVTATFAASTTPPPPSTAIRVNAGSLVGFTDAAGNAWEADRGFSTGTTASTATYSGPEPPLYSTQRVDPAAPPELTYAIDVPPGTYQVRLHFAEIVSTAARGTRVFDVFLEGTKVLNRFDVFRDAGYLQPLVRTFTVPVSDGSLSLRFSRRTGDPMISGIEIVPQ